MSSVRFLLREMIVYQHPALAPDLTVFENLAMGLPSKVNNLDGPHQEVRDSATFGRRAQRLLKRASH